MLKRFPDIILPDRISGQTPSVPHALDGFWERTPESVDDKEASFVGVGYIGGILGGSRIVSLVGAVEPGPCWVVLEGVMCNNKRA